VTPSGDGPPRGTPPSRAGEPRRRSGPPRDTAPRRLTFKMLRISILLAVLLVVTLTTWQERYLSTRWHEPLYVGVYPIAADDSPVTRTYLAALDGERFKPIDRFFTREANGIIWTRANRLERASDPNCKIDRRNVRRTPACWRPPCGACGCATGHGASANTRTIPRTSGCSFFITTRR
jgi:hypothetical protein